MPQPHAHVKRDVALHIEAEAPYAPIVHRRAILLVDHGSRRAEANAQLDALAALVRERAPEATVRVAHMELAPPTIAEAFEACIQDGAEEVVVVPCFLAPGRHAREDIPRLVTAAAAHHRARWRVTDVLGAHPLLADLVLVRAAALED